MHCQRGDCWPDTCVLIIQTHLYIQYGHLTFLQRRLIIPTLELTSRLCFGITWEAAQTYWLWFWQSLTVWMQVNFTSLSFSFTRCDKTESHTHAVVSNSIYSWVRKYCLRQISWSCSTIQMTRSKKSPCSTKKNEKILCQASLLPREVRPWAASPVENMFWHVGEYHHYYKELRSIIHKSFQYFTF